MKVEVTNSGHVAIVNVEGRVDSSTAAAFDTSLADALVGDVKSLVLECSHLTYLSSAGLRAILLAVKRTSKVDGKVAVCAVQSHILEVLEVSGFTRLVKVAGSVTEARSAIT
ncbi:MAG: STAS domain-containing protein [Gemmatimonadetes bacterium]|nr:STAS domain-containing protein [Gemmatimonadota bacterium]